MASNNPPPSPTPIDLLIQLLQNPSQFTDFRAALAASMASPTGANPNPLVGATQPTATAATATPVAAQTTVEETPTQGGGAGTLSFLRPVPLTFVSGDELEAQGGGETMKTPAVKKRNRPPPPPTGPKKPPTRRSSRTTKKTGPKTVSHVDLTEDEGSSPPSKSSRDEAAAGVRRRLPVDQEDHDASSTSPEKAAPEPMATDSQTAPPLSPAPTKPSGSEDLEEEVPISSVLRKLRRTQIKEGKKAAASVSTPVPPTAAPTPMEDVEEDEEMLEDSDVESSKALNILYYDVDSEIRAKEFREFECYAERNIDEDSFQKVNLINFLKSRYLLNSVTGMVSYPTASIRLLYANMSPKFGCVNSKKYGKVY